MGSLSIFRAANHCHMKILVGYIYCQSNSSESHFSGISQENNINTINKMKFLIPLLAVLANSK